MYGSHEYEFANFGKILTPDSFLRQPYVLLRDSRLLARQDGLVLLAPLLWGRNPINQSNFPSDT